ncbi:MAG: hypothetical protein FI729_01940 [SAR202 cluster bacterium]|nr:hypothetical protein [SAR202 cluster bacterium]|tara:strand:- start:21469 stop:25977 length:4509 start_codon:yes stop_codon:yes gene_type:complete
MEFKGVLGQKDKALHTITTQHPVFAEMGLVNFTSGQLWDALKDNKMLTTSASGEPSGAVRLSVYNQIMSSVDANHMHTDPSTKKALRIKLSQHQYFVSNPPTDDQFIRDLINVNNEYCSGVFNKDSNKEKYELLQWVKTCRGGFVQWSGGYTPVDDSGNGLFVDFTSNVEPKPSGVSGVPPYGHNKCVKPIVPKFQIRLFDSDFVKKTERPVVPVGAPKFIATPKTSFGKPYNWRGTDQDGLPPGQYADMKEGGEENVDNMVGGQLDVVYNKNTGKFEAGTIQLIARLLDDIDPAPINPIPDNDPTNLTEDVFDPASDTYMGFFATGRAVPLSVNHGNPYHFGPTWKGQKCKKEEKEILIAVNRSQRPFAAGEMVMLNKIDGEWIILPFGEPEIIKAGMFGVQQWQFMNVVSTSTHYFKKHDHAHELASKFIFFNEDTAHDQGRVVDVANKMIVRPAAYEAYAREEFYFGMMNTQLAAEANGSVGYTSSDRWWSAANGLGYQNASAYLDAKASGDLTDKIDPATGNKYKIPANAFKRADFIAVKGGYWQTSSFDMVAKNLGGNNKKTLLGQCRHDFNADGSMSDIDDDGTIPLRHLYPFWGAIFPGGFDANKPTTLQKSDPGLTRQGASSEFFFMDGDVMNTDGVFSVDNDANYRGGPLSSREYDNDGWPIGRKITPDLSLPNLPADIGTLASPSGTNGLPQDDLARIISYLSPDSRYSNGAGNMYYGCSKFFERSAGQGTFIDERVWTSGVQKRWQWLASASGSVTPHEGWNMSSAFDLEPAMPHKVSFYPATMQWHGSSNWHNNYGFRGIAEVPAGWFDKVGIHESQGNRARYYEGRFWNLGDYEATIGAFSNHSAGDIVSNKFFERIRRFPRKIGSAWGDLTPNNSPDSPDAYDTFRWGTKAWPTIDAYMFPFDSQGRYGYAPAISDFKTGLPFDYHVPSKAPNRNGIGGARLFGLDNPGSDVVNIVTAKCKLRARASELLFKTEQFLGTAKRATVGGAEQVTLGLVLTMFMFGTSSGGGGSSSVPQWGYGTDNVFDFGTTALHARVFDQWPNDQTVFDPRYFSVLHFNPGELGEPIRLEPTFYDALAFSQKADDWTADNPTYKPSDTSILVGSRVATAPGEGSPTILTSSDAGAYADGTRIGGHRSELVGKWKVGQPYPHYVDALTYGIDMREPTWGPTQTGPNGGFSIGQDGTKVLVGTIITGLGHTTNGIRKLRPRKKWAVNTIRRGKLLTDGPFKYRYRTIGAADLSHVLVASGQVAPGTTGASTGMDAGVGFQVGDFLSFAGGTGEGAELKVTAVETNKRTGEFGAIKTDSAGRLIGLEYVSSAGIQKRGSGYTDEDFPETDANGNAISNNPTYKVSLRPTNVQAGGKFYSGFEPRLSAGEVVYTTGEDRGPSERGGMSQLSLGSSNGEGNQSTMRGEPNGRVKGTRSTGYSIANETDQIAVFDQMNMRGEATPVGSFDVFFYFHSDPTYLSHDSSISIYNNQQNYITLDITTI